MDPVLFSLLLAAGFGAMWWQHHIRWRKQLGPMPTWNDEVEIALHLASHEAASRGQIVSGVHLVYALVQADAMSAAIETAGGSVSAIEDRVLDALAASEADPSTAGASDDYSLEAGRALAWSVYMARAGDRQVSIADVWAGLIHTGAEAVALVESENLRVGDVLFALVHGAAGAEPDASELEVVLVNDPMTTQELVVDILCDELELSREDATARMLEAHTRGSASIVRLPRSAARARVKAANERARSLGYPLWLRLEH